MPRIRILSSAEQVAEYLRKELASGVWSGEMPGVLTLAEELGINHKTVDASLTLLERDGLLAGQGARKPRLILEAATTSSTPSLKIGFLLHDQGERRRDIIVDARHLLIEAGHRPFFAKRGLMELQKNRDKVASFVERTSADAWLVEAAPRDVIEWFAAGSRPVFALFGFFRRLSIAGAGPNKTPAYIGVAQRLLDLGHRRIVLLARPQRRHPLPGHSERHFLQTLSKAGITVGDYHFPYWEDTQQDFHRCLDSLFKGIPPTALLIQEPVLFAAAQQFLAARGIRVPQDVSLICDDPDPTFAWQTPSVAHIRWEDGPMVRRLTQWAKNTANGKADRRQTLTKSKFITGGTIGAAPH